jgi:hypothetical protein
LEKWKIERGGGDFREESWKTKGDDLF